MTVNLFKTIHFYPLQEEILTREKLCMTYFGGFSTGQKKSSYTFGNSRIPI